MSSTANGTSTSDLRPYPAPGSTEEVLRFGPYPLLASEQAFAGEGSHALAIVNLKPLVPGHVLIIPRRVVRRGR